MLSPIKLNGLKNELRILPIVSNLISKFSPNKPKTKILCNTGIIIKFILLKKLLSKIKYVLDSNNIGINSNLNFGFFILSFFSKI